MDPKKVEALKASHGEHLSVVSVGHRHVVVKKPNRIQFNAFREKLLEGGGKAKVEGAANLVRDTLVDPSWDEYVTLVNEVPALEDMVARAAAELAQPAEEITIKKL